MLRHEEMKLSKLRNTKVEAASMKTSCEELVKLYSTTMKVVVKLKRETAPLDSDLQKMKKILDIWAKSCSVESNRILQLSRLLNSK